MTEHFYSNGKLLLTGEYAVLDGATALAIPTKYGQTLQVSKLPERKLTWKSYDQNNKVWFQCDLNPEQLSSSTAVTFTTNTETSATLLHILQEAQRQNSDFLKDSEGYKIETKVDFPTEWGLGTSSTLINNIAQWAQVNAFELLNNTMGGSGYDIACAQNDTPILYTKNNEVTVEKINFNPLFRSNLFFVFLNKKQNSRNAITHYRKADFNKVSLITRLNDITFKIAYCEDLRNFEILIQQHEQFLSEALGQPTVKSLLFSDYKGAIKSLGAWGGDFILATGNNATIDYFTKKGYHTIIPYSEMIL